MSELPRPVLVGVTGGSASGKTSLCNMIMEEMGSSNCVLITTDSFYKDLTEEQLLSALEHNFDHPSAFDMDEIYTTLVKLLNREEVRIPVYDYASFCRTGKFTTAQPRNIIIFEGIMALFDKRFRDLIDLKLFVHTDDDERLARRILRDIQERGRDVQSSVVQYRKFVKPSFDEFIRPVMQHADIIVPRGSDNKVAADLIIRHLKMSLQRFNQNSSLSNI